MEQENLNNFEDDIDDEIDQKGGLEKFREAVLYGTDWTVGTIVKQIEDGNLDLSPSFQRRDAWDSLKKSKFIESVALQLPIPQIVLAERKEQKGTYIVLDGKQRLLTLAQFAGNLKQDHPIAEASSTPLPLKLSGLRIATDLNGQTYNSLLEASHLKSIRTQFENHTIRSALIRNWPDDDYLYEVFIRLNTGSTKLSPQELRQALKPGEFTKFLDDFSGSCIELRQLLKLEKPDFRMRDIDILLRMIGLTTRLTEYRGDLKKFLDETHEIYNLNWQTSLPIVQQASEQISKALGFLGKQLGSIEYVGRRYVKNQFDPIINRAILDVQVGICSIPDNRVAIENATGDLTAAIEKACKDQAFLSAITSTTKSITAIRVRYTHWKDAIESTLGVAIILPELPSGK